MSLFGWASCCLTREAQPEIVSSNAPRAKLAEEEAKEVEALAQNKAEQEAAERKAAEEAKRKAEAEAAEAKRKAEADAEAKRKADAAAEAKRKAEAEAEAKRKTDADAEAKRKAEAEAEAKRKAEVDAEAKRKAEAEAEAKRKAEDEAKAAAPTSPTKVDVEAERAAEAARREAEMEREMGLIVDDEAPVTAQGTSTGEETQSLGPAERTPMQVAKQLSDGMVPSGLEQGDGKVWLVVGGLETGGIIVRKGENIGSTQLGRLKTGSRIEEMELVGQRLKYKRLVGEGPDFGWISISHKGKALVEPE